MRPHETEFEPEGTRRACGVRGCTEPAYRCDGCDAVGCMYELRKACSCEGGPDESPLYDAAPAADPADALRAENERMKAGLARVTAERDRLQRACDEGIPREVILCPNCKLKHVEGPRHDDPSVDGRTRPHHTHRCYHCGHVWDSGRWSFGVEVATGIAAELEAARADAAALRAELNELRASMRPRPEECPVDLAALDASLAASLPELPARPWAPFYCGDAGRWIVESVPNRDPALYVVAETGSEHVADFLALAANRVHELAAQLRRFVDLHARERAVRLSYEACISFETSCRGCAKALDACRSAEERAERAEAALATLREATAALGGVYNAELALDRVTPEGMRAVLARRGWKLAQAVTERGPDGAGEVLFERHDNPAAVGRRFGEPQRAVMVPVARLADWTLRVADWAAAVAARHGDVPAAAVLAEALEASRPPPAADEAFGGPA